MKQVSVFLLLTVAMFLAGLLPASAIYQFPDIEEVPVERLIENIERLIADHTGGDDTVALARLQEHLARVNAIAYAQGAQNLPVRLDTDELYEGMGWSPVLPYARDETRGNEAYLARALELYEALLADDPTVARWRIGYAWCLEESDAAEQAIEAYRAVVEASWPAEKDIDSLEYGELTLTQEAAYRLLALLDAERHATEIAELHRINRHFSDLPRWITPLVVPLADGLELSELIDNDAQVRFDLDGSGMARDWRWITDKAAWLVWDPSGTGKITSGLQFFGSVTFWLFWENGYKALAFLDDDRDGRLAGAEFEGLALWHDDGDGVSDPGEVKPLAEWGIEALFTTHEEHVDGFPYSPRGVLLEDGRTRPSYDWILPTAEMPLFLSAETPQ